jgi:hypothetical protein
VKFPKRLRITVLPTDLRSARRARTVRQGALSKTCPIARAGNRSLDPTKEHYCRVGFDVLNVRRADNEQYVASYSLPTAAQKFISAFDHEEFDGPKAQPITFTATRKG